MTSELSDRADNDGETKPRVIAFYLPQFHPTPENDTWWPRGFTEWRNVVRASPLFAGHQQPHVPSELGFYDLRVPEVRVLQAELARGYGIEGFCYYHYWFKGRRVLQRPFQEVLTSGEPDFPFCLAWANENWTRAWDAGPQEVLIEQTYDPEDDRRHIDYLIRAFKDPRYIRVDGRPLLLIYRVQGMPDPVRTFDLWRERARPPASTISTSSSSTRTGTSNRRKASAPTPPRSSYRTVCTRTCGSIMCGTAIAAMPCSGTSTWPASSRGGPHPIGSDFRA